MKLNAEATLFTPSSPSSPNDGVSATVTSHQTLPTSLGDAFGVPESQVDDSMKKFSDNADMNAALALRAQYAITEPKASRRRGKKLTKEDLDVPLVDTTAALSLRSKKTERMQKREQRRFQKAAAKQAESASLNGLPSELLTEVLSYLRPSDLYCLLRTSHNLRDFILDTESSLAREIIKRRYWNLFRCFPLPVPLEEVPSDVKPLLTSEKRLQLMNVHRKSYQQHILPVDPESVCTCMTCVLAWNNLCLILDLNHWQRNLEQREPIPMIARGTTPQWNQDLLAKNAAIVREAMYSTLAYAGILEKHLATITGTITRFWSRAPRRDKDGRKINTARLYNLTDEEAASGTDLFLERNGPPCYDFPFHRDNYYAIEAYMPNRKWGKDSKVWHYYALPPTQHERDLEWVMSGSTKSTKMQPATTAIPNLKP
jgi:hypothetical protein